MKRSVSFVITAICLLSVLLVTVFAHPGKTDSQGGHTNNSTGEYHYHHGYSEHSHYDMDGDGTLDCPYDFKDKTSSSSYTTTAPNETEPRATTPKVIESKTNETIETKEDDSVPNWVYWGFGIISVALLIAIKANKNKVKEIADLKYYHESDLTFLKRSYEEKLKLAKATENDLNNAKQALATLKAQKLETQNQLYFEQQRLSETKRLRFRMNNAPDNIAFNENGRPILCRTTETRPYGDYTVYMSRGSNIYHVDSKCASYLSVPAHIFDVVKRSRPCMKCSTGYFDFTDVPDWYKIEECKSERS